MGLIQRRMGVSVALAGALLLTAAGCGSRSTTSATGGNGASKAASTATSASTGGKTYNIKIAMATANDIQQKVGELWAADLKKVSGGQITASVYPGSQLGSNAAMNQGVQTGTIQAIIEPTGFLSPFVSQMGVLDMPFLFSDYTQQQKVISNATAMGPLTQAAAGKGFTVLSYFPYAKTMRNLITKFPVTKLSDIKGKKFRVFPSPELVASYKDWGASAVPMALSEVYTALQQGTIDGLDNPISIYYAAKAYEVAPYYTFTRHGALTDVIAVSKTWYDGLPASVQKEIQTSISDIQPQYSVLAQQFYNQYYTQKLKNDSKVHFSNMPAAQIAIMKKDVQPLYASEQADPSKGPILKAILAAEK